MDTGSQQRHFVDTGSQEKELMDTGSQKKISWTPAAKTPGFIDCSNKIPSTVKISGWAPAH
jgi:hypothetical protein